MASIYKLVCIHTIFTLLMICSVEGASKCRIECQRIPKQPVCATDGLSYPSSCEVNRQRECLFRSDLQVLHHGECGGVSFEGLSSTGTICETQRENALQKVREIHGGSLNTTPIMVPECTESGLYQKVQCHPATGFCWCANPLNGKPIQETGVRNQRPQCDNPGADRANSSEPENDCGAASRSLFNSNIIRHLTETYLPSEEAIRQFPLTGQKPRDVSAIARITFRELDLNNDKELTPKEMRQLKRTLKKDIKPKTCSHQFIEYCDRNKDEKISSEEWGFCLGGNSNLSFHVFHQLSADKPSEQLRTHGWNMPIRDDPLHTDGETSRIPELFEHQKRLFNMLEDQEGETESSVEREKLLTEQGIDRIDRSPIDNTEIDQELISLNIRTCMDERRSGLLKGNLPSNTKTFIPQCKMDGRYEPTQCHLYFGYCWCVNINTGVPIPGTSRVKTSPGCSNVATDDRGPRGPTPGLISQAEQTTQRNGRGSSRGGRKKKEIPGCPAPHHASFLSQLIDLLTREMAKNGEQLPTSLTSSAAMSLEEKSVRFKFMKQDKNEDGKLSTKEFKFVRKYVRNSKIRAPERCGKKFRDYCDSDNDDYLTMEEFLICTEVITPPTPAREGNRRRHGDGGSRRNNNNEPIDINEYTGENAAKNPFIDLLSSS